MTHEQPGLRDTTDDWAECSLEIDVEAWSDRFGSSSSSRTSRTSRTPPPAPPRRLARGSGRFDDESAASFDAGVHDAATMIRTPTAPGQRTLKLPLQAPSELDLDVFDDTGVVAEAEDEPTSRQDLAALVESFVELEPLPRFETSAEAFSASLAPAPRRYLDLCLAFAAGAATACVVLALLF